MSDNKIYYARREAHAIELAGRAASPEIAAIHHELALRYAILAVHGSQAQSNPPESATALPGAIIEPDPRLARKQA